MLSYIIIMLISFIYMQRAFALMITCLSFQVCWGQARNF